MEGQLLIKMNYGQSSNIFIGPLCVATQRAFVSVSVTRPRPALNDIDRHTARGARRKKYTESGKRPSIPVLRTEAGRKVMILVK